MNLIKTGKAQDNRNITALNAPNDSANHSVLAANSDWRMFSCVMEAHDLNADSVVATLRAYVAAPDNLEAEFRASKIATRCAPVGLYDYSNIETTIIPLTGKVES